MRRSIKGKGKIKARKRNLGEVKRGTSERESDIKECRMRKKNDSKTRSVGKNEEKEGKEWRSTKEWVRRNAKRLNEAS